MATNGRGTRIVGYNVRRFGFHEYVDTEAMFLNIFDDSAGAGSFPEPVTLSLADSQRRRAVGDKT